MGKCLMESTCIDFHRRMMADSIYGYVTVVSLYIYITYKHTIKLSTRSIIFNRNMSGTPIPQFTDILKNQCILSELYLIIILTFFVYFVLCLCTQTVHINNFIYTMCACVCCITNVQKHRPSASQISFYP